MGTNEGEICQHTWALAHGNEDLFDPVSQVIDPVKYPSRWHLLHHSLRPLQNSQTSGTISK